jgi:small subunit ribosomal protein S12
MITYSQLLATCRKKKKKRNRKRALNKCPQKKGVLIKLYIMTPKKPNSALRKVCKVVLSNYFRIIVSIPGSWHRLQKFCDILIRGGRLRDLPGVRYRAVRGVYDLIPSY